MVGEALPPLPPSDGTSLIFYHSEFWITSACPEKQRCPELFHCVEIFLSFRNLNNLHLPRKTDFPEIFHCNDIFFIFQDFWTTCACPENRVCPEMCHCAEYTFYIQDFRATCALPEFTALNIYFLSFGNLNNLRLPWKQSLPWNFSLYWI